MSDFPFLSPFSSRIPNYAFPIRNVDRVQDYLLFNDCSEEESSSPAVGFLTDPTFSTENFPESNQTGSADPGSSTMNTGYGAKKIKMETGFKIAFRTKSDLEIMDDGFKWRKYGKKNVKNSPNPRNYYRCSTGGCSVKKRVERDREDPSYVLTTYEGVHNHESPSVIYFSPHQNLGVAPPDQLPLMGGPHEWSLQAAHSTS